ncbi:MAG: cytochrome c3 family protein [candidate division Zixibacteria bacterium]
MKKVPQQIIPLAIIFIVAIAALVTARHFFVPETFGDYGHYRAASVDEIASQEVVYAGSIICNDCHDDIYETKMNFDHRGVSCEVCHGPAMAHTEEPDEYTPRIPRIRNQCTICHGYNSARPSGFPQVVEEVHNPGRPCLECHNPHKPLLPRAPQACDACHREIALQKAVSHHTSLECKTCHDAPPDHMSNPRFARAQKPTSRALCGKCHDTEADVSRGIPRIKLATHNENYLCWDCHYPHHPEAR